MVLTRPEVTNNAGERGGSVVECRTPERQALFNMEAPSSVLATQVKLLHKDSFKKS